MELSFLYSLVIELYGEPDIIIFHLSNVVLSFMEDTNENKRLRRVTVHSVSSSSCQNLNPSVPDVDQTHADLMISSLLSFPDSLATGRSFDRAFEKVLESSGDECIVDRGLQLAARLHESARRCARRRATYHNAISWPLPHELTVKVHKSRLKYKVELL